MRIARFVFVVALAAAVDASAQVTPPAPAPTPPQTPPAGAPPQPAPVAPGAPGAAAPAGPTPPGTTPPAVVVPPTARAFTTPTGMIFNAVRPERAVDFELVIGYLQAALAKATIPQVRAQAAGWRMYKATEPGPNNTVLYVFWFDPAIAAADYALGPILSDAYPDEVEQIWKLYQGALAGAGSQTLLNLTPVMPPPLPPAGAPVPPPAGTPPPAGILPPATTLPGAPPTTGPAARP